MYLMNAAATRRVLNSLHERLTELQLQLTTCTTTAMLRCVEGAILDTRRQMADHMGAR